MAYNSNPFRDEDSFEDLSEGGAPPSIRQQKDLVEQRMIDSTNRSLRMIYETQDIANETASDLHKQRQQLERTNQNLDKIQGDLKQTDRNITSIKSIWGSISNWFKKPIVNETPTAPPLDPEKEKENDASRPATRNNVSFQSTYDNMERPHGRDANAIVDKNLDNLLAGLDVLKEQGLQFGNELDEQNDLLEKIQTKVDKTENKIEIQNNDMKKILRK